MRQGGMKPKGHNNGNYWVRAHGGGSGAKKPEKVIAPGTRQLTGNPDIDYDSNGDGKADFVGWILFAPNPEPSMKLCWAIFIAFVVINLIRYW